MEPENEIREPRRSMKMLLKLFILVILMLTCGYRPVGSFPYPELLAKESGKYSVLYIEAQTPNYKLTHPEFIDNAASEGILTHSMMTSSTESEIKRLYPKLYLETLPVVVILDENGILLNTSDISEAERFLLELGK